MIISLTANSDTFVTNLNLKNVTGKSSNFGKASTLDLFKLYNENKYAYSKAILKFDLNNNIVDQSTINITDTEENTVTILFDVNIENNNNFNFDAGKNAYIVGINNTNPNEYTQRLSDAVNHLNNLELIKINAENNVDTVVLSQTTPGEIGDKSFVISEDLSLSVSSKTNENIFSRIDYSCILIKFNTERILQEFAPNGNSGAFDNVFAELVLKDVSTGVQKPKDYKLSCYRLTKEFFEGIGKDTVGFSDKDISNFVNLSNDNKWEIQEALIKSSDGQNSDVFSQEIDVFEVVNGDENITFNISSFINDIIQGNIVNDFGVLITFHDDILYNNKSYFAKRVGSRHLLKKSLNPEILVYINDSVYEYNINKNTYNVFDDKFDFYFSNNTTDSLKNIVYPTGYDQLTMTIDYNNETLVENIASEALYDYKGNQVAGLRKVTISQEDSPFNTKELIDASRLNDNYLNFAINWHFTDSNSLLEDILIKSYQVKINYFITDLIEKQNLYITGMLSSDLTASNLVYQLKTMVVDLNYRHTPTKIPLKLKTADIGNVYYQVVDYHTKEILVKYDFTNNSTKMFLSNDYYVANIYVPNTWVNKTITIEYAYFDSNNNMKIIKQDKQNSFKVN